MKCMLFFRKNLSLIFLCISSLLVSGKVSVFTEETLLLEIKSSLSDPHGLLASWVSTGGTHHCSWVGITCNSNSRVISVNITGCQGQKGKYPSLFWSKKETPLGCGGVLGGKLSPSVGRLSELRVLSLPFNGIGGEVPVELWGLEKLKVVNLEGNLFSGRLFRELCFNGLKKLRVLNLGFNRLEGVIPFSLSKCVDLEVLNLAGNELVGPIPKFRGGFDKIREVYLGGNALNGSVPGGFGSQCSGLEYLDLSGNFLVGRIPRSLGGCRRLRAIFLYSNRLTGVIPRQLGQLRRLQTLDVSRNFISGQIPVELGNSIDLSAIVLSNLFETWPKRNASGKVEDALPSVATEEHNHFVGSVPVEITMLPNLRVLWAPRAFLDGKLPRNWGDCRSLEMVNLAQNGFTGQIDEVFTRCKKLHHLDLSKNELQGKLETKLPAPCMTFLDLSGNHLTGPSPLFNSCVFPSVLPSNSYVFLPSRRFYNVVSHKILLAMVNDSLNNLSAPERALVESDTIEDQSPSRGFTSVEIASMVCVSVVVLLLLVIAVAVFCVRKRIPDTRIRVSEPKEITIFVDIGVPLTYEGILRATGNFNASHCIGSGGFGATYKAEVSPGNFVAVKKLAIGRIQGVRQFHAEIEALSVMKHCNLVTLICYHASEAEMFLVYNYLPGGNLEDFIKERSERAVNWKILHKIALHVAQALAYLHDECSPRVVHRDVKPSNILLDSDCNAYLSDFGLSRLMGSSESHVTTSVAGTFGYVAPEYAMTSRVSDKCDVYSYGVVLLELISDKKALDPSFSNHGDGFNIVSWAYMLSGNGKAKEFFTPRLWNSSPRDDLVDFLQLAIMCTVETLSSRPTMKQVVRRLKQIRPP